MLLGQPRGVGCIVSVKIWNDANGGSWLPLWEGPADVRAEAKTDVTREYYNLSPTICRPHFKSNKVRIEIDSETISDWNYIDYVQVR